MNEPLYQSSAGVVTLEDWMKVHSDERYMHVETTCHELSSCFPSYNEGNTKDQLNAVMSSGAFNRLKYQLDQLPVEHRPKLSTSVDYLLLAVKISNRIIMAVHTD
jgi:hypothetical protein